MGFQYEFNWILKLPNLNQKQLEIGQTYSFIKSGVRTFPLDMPIDLVNKNWEVVARCVIKQINITSKETKGEYMVIEIYDVKKRELLSQHWRGFFETD